MAEFDTLIKGGIVVDGSRAPRYRADVAVKDGRIAKIGNLKRAAAAQVLDARGLVVAPGAIDLHTHYDAQIHWDPYCSIDSWHGVTSVTLGNCGFGFAPVRPGDAERAMLTLTRNESIPMGPMKATMPFDWETFPQWMNLHRRELKRYEGQSVAQIAAVDGNHVIDAMLDLSQTRHAGPDPARTMGHRRRGLGSRVVPGLGRRLVLHRAVSVAERRHLHQLTVCSHP